MARNQSKKKATQRRPPERTRPTASEAPHAAPTGVASNADGTDASGAPADNEKQWASTRHGATAGRGFHYQDVVAAWCASRLLVSDQHTRVVPESHREDISCEGARGTEIQAKSRQNRVGPFPASRVAEHVSTLHSRSSRNQGAAIELVIERDIKEKALPSSVTRIGDLPAKHPLITACAQTIKVEGLPADAFDDITIRVLSFTHARRDMAIIIEKFFNIEQAVAARIGGDLVRLIAEASDSNAEATHATRAGVDRTALEQAAHLAIAQIDPTALIAAIASGACEPADLDTPLDDDTYFQGLDAQPGHIAAALPAPRGDEVDVVLGGLTASQSVLITGPSGVGKSTLMWMAAHVERHVTWYRINRLLPEDVEDIYRLAVGRQPSDAAPVGFLVDGVGIGEVEAWDRLVRRLEPLQHVVLIGTVRIEDIFAITSAHLSTRVDVGLDAAVAERIFNHLREAGHTTDVHWREAHDAADGLTLEYTYQLTQGTRLSAVLGAQVARLLKEGRGDVAAGSGMQ